MLKKIFSSMAHLLFPPLCLHCESLIYEGNYLCPLCQSFLELIPPQKRCPRCFSADYCLSRQLCGSCKKQSLSFNGLAAAFNHEGTAATLVQKMKYSQQPYLAKTASAFLAMQFLALEWPLPDLIVPVPITWLRLFDRGYNQSLELAQGLSQFLNRPIKNCLKRRVAGYSQAGLSRALRLQMDTSTFSLKKKSLLQDKIILLVDDVTTTGTTLNRCAEALQEQCPQAIYAITLCKAIK